jgi:hypothetical protein
MKEEALSAILGQGAVDEEVTVDTSPPAAFTIERLPETFKGIKSALKIFWMAGPNFQHSLITSAIKNAYVCYMEIFYEDINVFSLQTSWDCYFKNHLPVQTGEESSDSQSTNQPSSQPISLNLTLLLLQETWILMIKMIQMQI